MSSLDGVLPVDKPEGPTSHDVVGMARRALRTRRIGHTGTLDPFASGLLLLCVGPATRIAEYLTALPKSYTATLKLGETTDTDDGTGRVVASTDHWRDLDERAVREALSSQVGEIEQLPPRYSAKKVAGERMYAAARRGEEVERTLVRVTIHSLEVVRFAPPEVEFRVNCSSGTYIRAIARDAGDRLGVGAHLTRLRRTRVGEHSVEQALPIEELDDPTRVERAMISPAAALLHLPRQVVQPEEVARLAHGSSLPRSDDLAEGRPVALVSSDGTLLAIGEPRGERIQPRKVFA